MTDLDIIKQIEKELNVKLNKVDDIENNRGYILNKNRQIIGLGLCYCKIENLNSLIYSFKDLTNLTKLDLSNNLQEKISQIQYLTELTELNLSKNKIEDISGLKDLKNLTRLDLGSNQLRDIRSLEELSNLTELDLGSNQIRDISALKELGNLTKLDLGSNQLRDISALKELGNLTELNLNINQLKDISGLKELKNLTKLDLWDNQLRYINSLKELQNLMELFLGNNQIKDITALKDLKNLTELNLYKNQLSDISALRDLRNLTELNLYKNQLSDISALRDLKNLTKLNLGYNQLCNISALKELENLTELYLDSNQISDISALKDLKNLRWLFLGKNPIKELYQWITDFNLEILWGDFASDGHITFYDNPLQSPPVEIVKQGKEAIRNYFKALEDQKNKQINIRLETGLKVEVSVKGVTVKNEYVLNEIKILLIGEGMSGKTSMLKQLQGLPFDKNESQTHGVNIIQLSAAKIYGLEDKDEIKDYRLNFWDFGGQEIMHASHQFFLSERSIYILLLDSRTDSKKHYWLKHIDKYGGDSPIIVVMNKIDENPNYNIEQNGINNSYPNIKNRFHRISCQTREGIPGLVECIAKTIPETSLFNTRIPMNWKNVKDELVKATKENKYINRDKFIKICYDNDVIDESSQQTLLQFLHDIGVILYFKQLTLTDIYVLDPHWVTVGAYKIINSKMIKDGILNLEDLDYILRKEEIIKSGYDPAKEKNLTYDTPNEQRYILDIMMLFELCYEYNREKTRYVIPDLLPKELDREPELDGDKQLRFIIKYDYLPKSIISRLMIKIKNDIIDGNLWRYGMILKNEDLKCTAKVKVDEEKNDINITIQGEYFKKRQYLSIIRHYINDITSEFHNLNPQEFIPLPGYPNVLVEYQELLGHEKAGMPYFSGKLGKSFPLDEILDSVASKDERQKNIYSHDQLGENIMNIENLNVYGQVNISDVIKKIIYKPTTSYTKEQFEELKATLGKLQDEKLVELKADVEKIEDLKSEAEKETRGEKIKRKLLGFGVSVVEHMTAIGVVEALKHFFV